MSVSRHTSTFARAQLKLERAATSVSEIIDLFSGYRNTAALIVKIDKEVSDQGDRFARLMIDRDIPDLIPIIVGEVIYHVRSVLDQVVTQISIANGAKSVNQIYYPFADSIDEIERERSQLSWRPGRIQFLPEKAQNAIVESAPYRDGNIDLWSINKMARIDRHIDFVPMDSGAASSMFRWFHIDRAKFSVYSDGSRNLREGIKFSNLGQCGTIRPNGGIPSVAATVVLAFGDVPVYADKQVVPSLATMVLAANDAIGAIEAALKSSD